MPNKKPLPCDQDNIDRGRKALAVDPDIKAKNLARLNRIEGQVRGLYKMVEADRYCPDILSQLSAVHEALRGVGRELMRNHLRHCLQHAAKNDSAAASDMYDELVQLMYQNAR
ncbi:MAG: metal-sensitive transcriptional regulator [Gemmataceae bacterium]|nr:metal-sensitive transcriptional regulator [Gemmataceae bacterium]